MSDLKLNIKIKSVAPALMHCNQAVNPLNKYAKAMKQITSKRNKTEDDLIDLYKLEWESALYYLDGIGPYWPSTNIEKMLHTAAKKLKLGNDALQSIMVLPTEVPLLYNGPRKLEELKAAAFSGERINGEDFSDIRTVKVMRASINRCRPRFNNWGCEFQIVADGEVFNVDEVVHILQIAATKIGLSDYRPRYGRFEFEIVK